MNTKSNDYSLSKGLLLLFLVLFAALPSVWSQTLKTDVDIPNISACGPEVTFEVRIGRGAQARTGASLQIEMPEHFAYQLGSVQVDGISVSDGSASADGTTITFDIPASTGASDEDVVITYKVRAMCEAISTSTLPVDQRPSVGYTLTIDGTPLTGDSEAINIRYAVMNVSISPIVASGLVNQTFPRTVTIKNNGLGELESFTVERQLGDDLSLLSSDLPTTVGSSTTVGGWTVTQSTEGVYLFTGSLLQSGEQISFEETVRMDACGSINTTYEAYYGCTDKCTLANVNDSETAVITVNMSSRPVLQRSVERVDGNYRCFDEDYEVVWKITNTGTATATGIQLRFGSYHNNTDQYGSTHIVLGAGYEMADDPDFTTNVVTLGLGAGQLYNASQGDLYGTTGLPVYQNFTLPNDIAPGQTVYIRYTQRNNSPVVSCENQAHRILYGSIIGHSGESFYKNADACDPDANIYNFGGAVEYRRNGNTNMDGSNVGSLEASDGVPFSGKYRISSFYIENAGSQFFAPGDYIDIVLEVSPSLASGLSDAILSGGLSSNPLPVAVPDGPGKVRFRFEFGTPNWPSGNLVQSLMFLDFNSVMVCPGPSWYKVSYEVNRLECGDSYIQKCQTYNITTFCGTCEEGGLGNRETKVTRLTYGAVAQNPDNQGKPQFPLETVDPESSAVPIQTSFFMAGDVVEISQVGISRVTGLSPVTEWTAGHFGFTVPNLNLGIDVVPNSGKMVITRGTDTYTITGLPVSMSGLVAGMDFDMALLHANGLPITFTGFQDNDQLVSSIQITANGAWPSTDAAINFATTYHFIHNSNNYACAPGWRATGLMGRLALNLYRGGGADVQRNLTNCGQQPNYARFDVAINGGVQRNVLFPNEYRQFIFPKKLIMTVPAGLSVDRVQASIYEQGYSTVPRAEIDITPVSGGTVEIELEDHLAAALAESMATIDEGLRIDFNPRTSPTCEATDQVETITMRVEYEAVIPHRQSAGGISLETAGTYQTNVVELNYLPDNSKISAQLINPTVPSTDGTASWVVAVVNSSDFRIFANTWLGGADIVSVQQVTNLAGTTTTGAPLTAVNGVYQIGALPVNTTRYYRVTTNVADCDDGSIDIAFGHSCDGYPTSVADAACVVNTMTANYTQVFANLQMSIENQPSASYRPKLCEELSYTVSIFNAGQGAATDLMVDIPLTIAEGLLYVDGSLEIKGPGDTNFLAVANAAVDVNTSRIRITIPAERVTSLATGQRVDVRLRLGMDGCNFRSGQRIAFYPTGKNGCGSDAAFSSVATNRVTIDGAPTNLPVISVDTETATICYVSTTNGDLKALYNFTFTNAGDGVNNYILNANDGYKMNIKLPAGWEFEVADPQTLVDANMLIYSGLDPVRGYVYEFIDDLTIGSSVEIADAVMVYTGDASVFTCGQSLDPVLASVYRMFSPESVCGYDCDIEQVVMDSEAPMTLPVIPVPTTDDDEVAFCESEDKTLADLTTAVINESGIVVWYAAATNGTPLANTDVLSSGTYYAVLKDGATGCESPTRLAIDVIIDEEPPAANAGVNQSEIDEVVFTLAGNQAVGSVTGEWTFVSGTDTDGNDLTAADVIFADATLYNSTVTLPDIGSSVILAWTLTNGSCSSTAYMSITSVTGIPAVTVNKIVDEDEIDSPGLLTYTITVENTGNVPLTDLTVLDEVAQGGTTVAGTFVSLIGDDDDNNILDVNETWVYTYTYEVDQAHIDNGGDIVNTFTFDAEELEEPESDNAVTIVDQFRELILVKTAGTIEDTNGDSRHSAGDEIVYTFTLTNTGNVTVENPILTDAKLGLDGAAFGETSLAPGDVTVYTATYTLTQADINAGEVSNTAVAKGQDPNGDDVEDTSDTGTDRDGSSIPNPGDVDSDGDGDKGNDPTVLDLDRNAELTLIKTAGAITDTNGDGRHSAGDEIVYTFTLTNTGNVTVENPILTDAKLGLDGAAFGETSLAPGDVTVYTATYTLTQADINAGEVSNTAVAKGQDPNGDDVEDTSDTGTDRDGSSIPNPDDVDSDGDGEKGNDPTVLDLDRVAELTIMKVADREEVVELGEEVVYTITVRNTGNVSITGVEVTDILFPDWSETIAVLAPGANQSYTLTYVAGQEDFNAGRIVNVASAMGSDPEGEEVPSEAPEVIVPVRYINNLVVTKDADKDGVDREGETITYSITVTNRGNQPLSNVTVVDPLTGMNETIAELGVGEAATFTTEYVVKLEDFLSRKEIVNVATAKGENPQGVEVEGSDDEVVTLRPRDLFIPNVFTPNGDGTNDTFEIVGHENYDRIDLVIINRWGNEVYRSENYRNEWNGNGLNEGTYYYIIKARRGGQEKVFKGWVLIKKR